MVQVLKRIVFFGNPASSFARVEVLALRQDWRFLERRWRVRSEDSFWVCGFFFFVSEVLDSAAPSDLLLKSSSLFLSSSRLSSRVIFGCGFVGDGSCVVGNEILSSGASCTSSSVSDTVLEVLVKTLVQLTVLSVKPLQSERCLACLGRCGTCMSTAWLCSSRLPVVDMEDGVFMIQTIFDCCCSEHCCCFSSALMREDEPERSIY